MSEEQPGGGGGSGRDEVATPTTTTEESGSTRTAEVLFPSPSPGPAAGITTSLEASSSSASSSLPPVTIFQLSRSQRILAGSGHVLNDLCASLWFTYLLLYMQKVVKFKTVWAAGLLLWGQVVDGVATPLVGYETDHVESLWPCIKSYGRCKSWHLLGIILVMLSFPFIFSPCVGYSYYTDEWSQVPDWKKAIYYAPFIAIFQIGWACTQISHLALIPKLTPDDLMRTEILAIRYAFTVGANVTVFLMTWLFLSDLGNHSNHKKCSVDTDDSSSFSYVAFISVGLGGLFSILFHAFVIEKADHIVKRSASILKVQESMTDITERDNMPSNAMSNNGANNNRVILDGDSPTIIEDRQLRRNRTPTRVRERDRVEGASLLASDNEDDEIGNAGSAAVPAKCFRSRLSSNSLQPVVKTFSTKSLNMGKERMGVDDWLKLPQFYMVACLYLSTRLAVNLSQTYMPFYVEISLSLDCSAVAVIPLTMYCSGFVVSLVIKMLNKYLGRQMSYAIGTILIVIGACLILFLDWTTPARSWQIYLVAVLIGGGSSAILVTSLSITADLIGNNIESGAFVYGAMSFCDKISCGLAVVLINNLIPCTDEKKACTKGNKEFYTDALGFSTGGSALAGLMFIIILTVMIFRKSKRPSTATAIGGVDVSS